MVPGSRRSGATIDGEANPGRAPGLGARPTRPARRRSPPWQFVDHAPRLRQRRAASDRSWRPPRFGGDARRDLHGRRPAPTGSEGRRVRVGAAVLVEVFAHVGPSKCQWPSGTDPPRVRFRAHGHTLVAGASHDRIGALPHLLGGSSVVFISSTD